MLSSWKTCCMHVQQRWVFAFMGFFGTMNMYTMRNCLSITITEMVVPVETNSTSMDESCYFNETTSTSSPRRSGTYEWDEHTQGIILSSFYWGYILTHLPGGMIAERFGGKYTLGLGMLSTAICTLLVPLAVTMGGSTALILLRFIMGLAGGIIYPTLNNLIAKWSPPHERSKISFVVLNGMTIGTVIANSVSGVIIYYSSIGWPAVFYFFGGCGVLWFFVWLILGYSTPHDHPFISDREKKFLHDNMAAHTHRKAPTVSWRHILRSGPVWAYVCCYVGHDWNAYTINIDLPKYMSGVLKFSIVENGFLSASPHLFASISGIAVSCVADWVIKSGHMTIGKVRKLTTALSCLGPIVIIIASYAGCDRVMAVVFLNVAMIASSISHAGVGVNVLDLSPNYAGSLTSLGNGIGALTGIATPYVVGVLTPHQTVFEWRIVFWIALGVHALSDLIFVIWASGEVQYWNDPEFVNGEREERYKMKTLKREKDIKQ